MVSITKRREMVSMTKRRETLTIERVNEYMSKINHKQSTNNNQRTKKL